MKKSVLIGLFWVVSALLLVVVLYFGKENGSREDKDTAAAISLLQKEGYSEIKVIDNDYITAIPLNHDGMTPFVGALDSLVLSAKKDGTTFKLRVKKVGLPEMSIEKM